ncbi:MULTISPECIES: MarR family winged helix-turn-helix transcriptional regulator [Thalassospira]|uniref:MarR family transcriptional regulator n=1 Tax=Thalassospira xiamenensis TaxID=220697 RepID=A0ABR5Y081_9PROT|nr:MULTISPECIES: MarR family transcriptional regulator [Thalassospira]MBR9780642.1 MarR family transcriptional regulator [Rhodospirillales bacterium]PTB85370.1 MarR family transcriptional regulator [Pseudidiomarina aestuarii]KZD01701.1 MarR family transcriptional regulator [Thalassospira xiamenensis]KZD02192.1 MarR family transcriptional regulator [Thalassospira sp. MCCC 1A02898]KZD11346.1 MarR family transcriptional regulator [Thalassospira xiamenensis]
MTDKENRVPNSRERLAHIIRLATRGFNRSLQIRLASHHVTFGQWIFLRILWEQEGLTQRELSEEAGLTEPTTHTALQRLEALGFLEKRTLAGNKRKQHVFLTKRGKELRIELEPLAVEVNEVALAGLSSSELDIIRKGMLLILDNLEEDERKAGEEGRKVPPTRIPT